MPATHPKSRGTVFRRGFTLIELSVVLVIIGLIVGSVLVGRNLIDAAAIRSQISQIEKYQTAVNTFRGKYGYLPGDIPDPDASRFGFQPRLACAGCGDGNGIIENVEDSQNCARGDDNPSPESGSWTYGLDAFDGENGMFWIDLSTAHLVDGGFSTQAQNSTGAGIVSWGNIVNPTGLQINYYLPQAKIGNGNYMYVWSGGWMEAADSNDIGPSPTSDSQNYFGLSAVIGNNICNVATNLSITVAQAYAIDKKMDDGLPQSGNVTAMYPGSQWWSAGGNNSGNSGGDYSFIPYGGPVTSAGDISTHVATSTSCYDASKGIPEQYSITYQNGSQPNCALSFKFQ